MLLRCLPDVNPWTASTHRRIKTSRSSMDADDRRAKTRVLAKKATPSRLRPATNWSAACKRDETQQPSSAPNRGPTAKNTARRGPHALHTPVSVRAASPATDEASARRTLVTQGRLKKQKARPAEGRAAAGQTWEETAARERGRPPAKRIVVPASLRHTVHPCVCASTEEEMTGYFGRFVCPFSAALFPQAAAASASGDGPRFLLTSFMRAKPD